MMPFVYADTKKLEKILKETIEKELIGTIDEEFFAGAYFDDWSKENAERTVIKRLIKKFGREEVAHILVYLLRGAVTAHIIKVRIWYDDNTYDLTEVDPDTESLHPGCIALEMPKEMHGKLKSPMPLEFVAIEDR